MRGDSSEGGDDTPRTLQDAASRGSNDRSDHSGDSDELRRARNELGDQLLTAEDLAALKAGRLPTSAAMQERDPGGRESLGNQAGLYKQSVQNRKKGGGRGIFIGLGAGGGITSAIAGFAFLLPFKLPAIMDTLIDDAGKRVENVIERRAERVFLRYILRGSVAAGKNGNLIATGNPLGDVFANIRTSRFEADLKLSNGLSFEPGPDKTVRLVHDGKPFGDAKTEKQILELLEKGSLSRSDLRKIVRTQIPAWRFFKRAKFVNWLRLKYNVPRFGAREQQPGEKDEDYLKSINEDHITQVSTAQLENATDFIDCAAKDDCQKVDKTKEGTKFREKAAKAIAEVAKEVAGKAVSKIENTFTKLVIKRIIAFSSAAAIPVIGEVIGPIDISARIMHTMGNVIDNDLIVKMHAQFIKRSTGVLGALYAGYSDQTKAGDLAPAAVGMFADRFDGWEESVSYGLINSGKVVGVALEGMEKINETILLPAFAGMVKTLFDTVGWISRAPLEAWYHTVSKLFDLVGDIGGDAVSWLVDHTPAKALVAQFTPYLEPMFEGLFKIMGMFVDPLGIGARLAMFIHEGLLGVFNDQAKDIGMRLLNHVQAVEMDQTIRAEHIAAIQNQSLYDRIFNAGNPDSLASSLASTMPSYSQTNPALALATSTTQLVADAPANFARVTTNSAYAAGAGEVTSEELFGGEMRGGTEGDLAADLDPSVERPDPQNCPANNDNSFNHCTVDRQVVDSIGCVFVKCEDLEVANAAGDSLFAANTEPMYGPDSPAPAQKPQFAWANLVQPFAFVGAFLPIAALEISRRRGDA